MSSFNIIDICFVYITVDLILISSYSDPNQQEVKVAYGNANKEVTTASRDDLYAVRCCSSFDRSGDGWMKKNVSCPWGESDIFGKCFYKVTFDTAKAICEADNARLCSESEINSGCTTNSGCGHDHRWVWISNVV